VLIFTGGWGGPELAYETILTLEKNHRVIVIDVGSIDQPAEMVEVAETIMDQEGISKVAVVGQSISGILGQVFFRQKPERVDRMVLALTPAPHQEKARKWALSLIQKIPLFLFRLMLAKSLRRLSRTDKPIPEEVAERLSFKQLFTGMIFRGYATQKKLVGVLRLAFALSSAGDYSKEEVSGWSGKLLVITSPDDPYYKDTPLFQEVFPRTEVVTLEEGFGHVAPQVFQKSFFSAIQDFLE
jgi:pimeloyl-ACP methyl ester carboxylesterase